jgi:hypothetical protein
VDTAGKLRVQLFWFGMVNQVVSANSVNDGQFHHLAATYDNATHTENVYLDGQWIGSKTLNQVQYNSSYQYQLGTGYTGAWPAGNGSWFNFDGVIDEPSVYNCAVAVGDIQAIYNAGANGKRWNGVPAGGAALPLACVCSPVTGVSVGTVTVTAYADADADGLDSNQESLLGTNPAWADTDGDGLSDGAEVALGRDPLHADGTVTALSLEVFTPLNP